MEFIEGLGLAPELIDSISHVQEAHQSLAKYAIKLRERDEDLADDWKDTINALLEEMGNTRHLLLRMMTEIAACTWQ